MLEVGGGTGDDARALAQRVGPSGWVLAIDVSEQLVAVARERSLGSNLPVEFRLQDVHRLDLPEASFDASRADRTFQHLERPQEALAQMVRVTRPGGIVCLCEPDWSTFVVDSRERELTRTILDFAGSQVRHGWMGRQLRRLLREANLEEVSVTPFTLLATDYTQGVRVLGLEYAATQASQHGVITPDEAARWLSDLQVASEQGSFFAGATVFVASGKRADGEPAAP